MSWDQIKEDLKPLGEYEVVLFGSYISGEHRKGSNIDIAVITKTRDERKNISILKELLVKVNSFYEVRIFELLPLKVKASVMKDYTVVFGDELEISEYFYYWRKLWNDVKHRISYHKSYKEKLMALERGKRIAEKYKS